MRGRCRLPARRPDVVYGFGRIDASGPVAERATIAALSWRGGDRLTLTADAGVMIARRDPGGLVTMPARPYVVILVIEVLREHGQLRTSGVRIDSHPLILAPGTGGAVVLAPAAAGGASPAGLAVNDGTGRRASILDEHAGYLRERWNAGCTNAAQLWQEIRDRGYQGSCRQARGYLARFRGNAAVPGPSPGPAEARDQLDHDQARPARRRQPAEPGCHPRRVPGARPRRRHRPHLRRHHERTPRPQAARALDDRRHRHRRARARLLRHRPAC